MKVLKLLQDFFRLSVWRFISERRSRAEKSKPVLRIKNISYLKSIPSVDFVLPAPMITTTRTSKYFFTIFKG